METSSTSSGAPAVVVDGALPLAELSRIALAELSLQQVLERVAVLARDTIPGAAEVSVTLVVNDRPTTPAFTGELARDLDESQYARGFGPCLDAARGAETMHIPDMATETRWPQYCQVAARRGVGSGLSITLPVQEHVVGALNIYGARPHAFPAESVELGLRFADYAAVAVANAHLYTASVDLAEGMRAAMASRAVIEQAKGILIARHGCSAEEAFGRLTILSQHANRKLRDIAAALVAQAQQEHPGTRQQRQT